MMKALRKKRAGGFTLIELIVVIAILGILAAIAIPRFAGFTENAKEASDEQLVALIANAAALYYASTGDTSITTAEINAENLIQYATDAAIIAELKSAKYTAGTATVTYTLSGGAVTVAIGGTTTFSVTK